MLAIAATAKTFGQRPSALLGISDSVVALDFDCAAALRLRELLPDAERPAHVERLDW
jgi:hypothetical protein